MASQSKASQQEIAKFWRRTALFEQQNRRAAALILRSVRPDQVNGLAAQWARGVLASKTGRQTV